MENKIITDLNKNLNIKYHPNIKGVQIIEGKNNFPISWLNQQGYCEYQLYLQYFQGVKVGETQAMTNRNQSAQPAGREVSGKCNTCNL